MEQTLRVGTAATAGRIGMIVAAVATFVTLFSANIFAFYSRIDVIATFGVIAVAGSAIAGIFTPRRVLDVVALVAGGSLAGFLSPLWVETSPASTMAMLAWLLLVASCVGVAIGLSTGRPEADPRAVAAMTGAAGRIKAAASPPHASSFAVSEHAHRPADLPDPGWYPDADGQQLRWWDGHGWTDHVRPRL